MICSKYENIKVTEKTLATINQVLQKGNKLNKLNSPKHNGW